MRGCLLWQLSSCYVHVHFQSINIPGKSIGNNYKNFWWCVIPQTSEVNGSMEPLFSRTLITKKMIEEQSIIPFEKTSHTQQINEVPSTFIIRRSLKWYDNTSPPPLNPESSSIDVNILQLLSCEKRYGFCKVTSFIFILKINSICILFLPW